ncbi:MAG: relaxase/mobilization nuclease domain-containing protein, partial [Oscillospiraceae bacterium]
MATTKLIPIRGNNGASILASISARNDYYTNPEKTNEKQYVSSYECNVDTASEEFVISKNLYANRTGRANTSGKGVLAYQIRQSFKPDEITPELANKIGYELALEFTKSKHQFIVATHIDKAHIHNHICFNSTNLDSDGKFNNYKNSAEVVRKISDRLCKENELSIVENPNIKGVNYFEWQERKKGTSWKSFIKNTIDEILPNCKTFDEFLKLLQKQGFEVKQGKYIAFKPPNGERFSRGKTLGNAYTETALKERLGKAKSYAVLFEDDIGNLIKV